MVGQKNKVTKPSLTSAIFKILFLPRQASKKMSKINSKLKLTYEYFKDPIAMEAIGKNNEFVRYFIRLPIIIGLFASLTWFYFKKEDIFRSFDRAATVVYSIKSVKSERELRKYLDMVSGVRLEVNFILPFLALYGFSFVGVYLIYNHPFVKKEEEIKALMLSNKYVDENGEPWDFAWTPYSMMFISYNADVNAVHKNKKFWAGVNINPDDPKILEEDSTIFYFGKSYELPKVIPLDVLPVLKGKAKTPEQLANELVEKAQMEQDEKDSGNVVVNEPGSAFNGENFSDSVALAEEKTGDLEGES